MKNAEKYFLNIIEIFNKFKIFVYSIKLVTCKDHWETGLFNLKHKIIFWQYLNDIWGYLVGVTSSSPIFWSPLQRRVKCYLNTNFRFIEWSFSISNRFIETRNSIFKKIIGSIWWLKKIRKLQFYFQLRVEGLRGALHMFGKSRYASGEEMVTRMWWWHHWIPLKVSTPEDGVR